MKTSHLFFTGTLLSLSLVSATPSFAQNQEITCVILNQDTINCPGYGSFKYRNDNTNVNSSLLEEQINSTYIQVLGRNATANELKNYSQKMKGQNWSLMQVRSNLVINNQEFNQVINNNIYQEFLGRNADVNELRYLQNLIINGQSIDYVRNSIANTVEARSRNNYNNVNNSRFEDQINNTYLQVLGRRVNPNELNNYSQKMNDQSWSLMQVRRDVVHNNSEFNQVINNIHQELLGRNTNPAELQSIQKLVIDGQNLDYVRNSIANSPEARNINNTGVNNLRTEQAINNIFSNVLGRNANPNDLRDYSQKMNDENWSLMQVRREVASKPELNQAINKIYQEFLGREADKEGLEFFQNLVINGDSLQFVRNSVYNSPEAKNRRQ